MATLADLETRVAKIEHHLAALHAWNVQVAKLLQKVDIECVVKATRCPQTVTPGHAGVPSDPPKWP